MIQVCFYLLLTKLEENAFDAELDELEEKLAAMKKEFKQIKNPPLFNLKHMFSRLLDSLVTKTELCFSQN